MRADRLVALLLLLQTRTQVTVPEVARELEISERTARRDLEALGIAGIPVYSRQGRNGGWQLLGGARTDLSGLTSAEARALFLVAGPSSTVTPQVKAALRKLLRALPETFRSAAEAASTAILADPTAWARPGLTQPTPTHLDELQRAVIEGEQLEVAYVARDRSATVRVVHPLGLATKDGRWYLVADTDAGMRTFRVDRVHEIVTTGRPVVRPKDFDLAAAWQLVNDRVSERYAQVVATGWAHRWAVYALRAQLGDRLKIGPASDDGRVSIEVSGPSERALAGDIAAYAGSLEIFGPPSLRALLHEIGATLTSTYAPATDQPAPATDRPAPATGRHVDPPSTRSTDQLVDQLIGGP